MKPPSSPAETTTLNHLLDGHPKKLRDLFIRTLNLHAGYQIKPLTGRELVAYVRKDIEQSLDSEQN